MKTKRIKKVFTIMLAGLTVMSFLTVLTSCGNSDKPQGDNHETASAEGKNPTTTVPETATEPAESTTEPTTEVTEKVEANYVHPEFHKLIDESNKTDEFVCYRICTGEYVRLYEEGDYRYINDPAPLFEDTADTFCLAVSADPENKEEVLFKLLNETEKGAEDLKLYGYLGRTYPDATQEEFDAMTHIGNVYGRPFRLTDADGRYLDNAYALDDLVGLLTNSDKVVEYTPDGNYEANTICLLFQKSFDTMEGSEVHYYKVDDELMETVITLMKRYWDNESVEKGGTPLDDYGLEERLINDESDTTSSNEIKFNGSNVRIDEGCDD